MSHFDEMTALLYLESQLDAEHARDIAGHAVSCAECRELLHALETEGVWLRESLVGEDESVPAHLTNAPERHPAPWGWISALGLSAGGAYTLWSGFVEPWRAQAAQAGFTQGNLFTMLFFSGAFWKGWDAMRSLMEFLAVATLGLVVMWLLRRRWRSFPTIAVVMGAIICSLAIPPAANAAETRHGNPNYTLPAGEEVKTDLIVFADHTQINGDIDGDLIVWSRNVTVNGHVKGDVIAFAQELRVDAPVDGNVRAFSQTIVITSNIGKNVMVFGSEMNLRDTANVGGTITLFTGDTALSGHIAGDLLAFGGNFDINGVLGHDAAFQSDTLSIGPSAEIKGRTKFEGKREAEVSPSAKLGSPVEFTLKKRSPEKNYSSARFYWHQTLLWGASFVFGLVVLLLAPGFFFDAERACKKVGQSIGLGLLFLFVTPIAAIIICITIVGLGVGISAIFLWVIAIYSAQVYVGSWLGERILGEGVGVGSALGRLAVGLLILRAVRMVPYLGGWIAFIVVAWGMGAMVLALYRYMRPQLATAI
ncbi:MAG: polymer-forming cytoskeletal protein [Candidatus Acidiferrales bacterium]